MLQTIVLFAHLLVAAMIIGLVLLQRGKGAEAGTGFGAGASGTVFGARGSSSFFSRATAVLATLFFATSLSLAYFARQVNAPDSVLEGSILDESGPSLVPAADDLPALDTGGVSELPELEVPESSEQADPQN